MAKTKYYTSNPDKRTVTIDSNVTPTRADKDEVAILVEAGYKLCRKSEAKAKKAKERASKLPNKEEVKKLLEAPEHEKALAEFNKTPNFFTARSNALSYLKKYAEEHNAETKETENKE